MKLQLPAVSLVCIDCIDSKRAISVLERCKSLCDFGAVKLLTNIPTPYEHRVKIKPLNTLIMYSVFMLTKVAWYIDTEKVLIVQRDGWILNPSAWKEEWLGYDYIAPLFMQYDMVGSGGFSLRSKKMLQDMARLMPDWDWTQKHAEEIQSNIGYYEDGMYSLTDFAEGYNIAPPEEAANFAQGGNRNPKYFREKPFGFHRTFQEIDFKTGIVNSSDLSKDICVSYDHEIDAL